MPSGDGAVPCINAIQFLCREQGLVTTYFLRGQDVFRKFYPDAVCIYEMAQQVASALGTRVDLVVGGITSAHVYLQRIPANSPPVGWSGHGLGGPHAE